MKRYIAICGSSNSGIRSKEDALAWAADHLGANLKNGLVHLCEVIEVVERAQPAITSKPFFVQLDESVAKAA